LIQLEQEQVGKGGLRPFDLRGKDRFLADVGIEEEKRVGEE
jgi:hypothetical protein